MFDGDGYFAFDHDADDANIGGIGAPWPEEEPPLLTTTFRRLLGCRRGATAIEYGLIAGLIFLVIVVAVTTMAGNMTDMYNMVANAVTGNL